MHPLAPWGFDAAFQAAFAPFASEGLVPGRVVEEQRDLLQVVTPDRTVPCTVGGRLRHEARGRLAVPVVGDFVAVTAPPAPGGGRGVVRAVLPRRSLLVRKSAGETGEPQPIAAGLDVVLVATSANHDFNERRLERYVTVSWESGAQPVVLLTKADLVPEIDALVARAEAAAPGVPVIAVSAATGQGLDALSTHLAPARTAALVGSSGVGKSTLVNRLLGVDLLATRPVSEHEDKGRHTTTSRRLLALPTGALLVDTPGMRELGLCEDDGGLETAFADVEELARRCKFKDCAHDTEPGCAVRSALETGALDPDRWASYGKLRRELAYLARRDDPAAMAAENARWRRKVAENERWRRATGAQ